MTCYDVLQRPILATETDPLASLRSNVCVCDFMFSNMTSLSTSNSPMIKSSSMVCKLQHDKDTGGVTEHDGTKPKNDRTNNRYTPKSVRKNSKSEHTRGQARGTGIRHGHYRTEYRTGDRSKNTGTGTGTGTEQALALVHRGQQKLVWVALLSVSS